MIDDYTLIADLFGKRRSEARPAESRTSTIVGVATSNSVDGSVRVRIDGDLTGGEDGELVVPTDAHIVAGDVVSISLVGGTAKAPRVTGTVGGGDRIYASLVETNQLVATKADITDLTAAEGRIGTLEANALTASSAVITDLQADTAKVHDLTANELSAATGYVGDLVAGNLTAANLISDHQTIGSLDVSQISADHATIASLDSNYAQIDLANIANGTIKTAMIDDGQITSAKILNGTIANADIANGTIESAKIKDGTITTAKIGDAQITTAKIGDAQVTNAKIAAAAVGTANIQTAAITTALIADEAVGNAQIADVSANKLTAGTIDASNITVTNLNASNITAGSITVDGITIDVENNSAVIDGDAIEDGTITMSGLSQDVRNVIDGAIETHTGTVVPTLNNSPASSWSTTALKDQHVGDVYYVVNSQSEQNGYCYRFTKSGSTYSWQLIKDSDVTAALSRLQTAEGKIGQIETFDSTVSSFMTDTDSELTSVKNRTTSLETRVTTAEGNISNKVDTSTFNTVSQKVDANEANITSLSTVVTNNGLTESTNISNTVNTVSQKATSNESKISQLTTTLGTNADGTTKTGDIMHRTSDIEQDLDGFKTTVSQTYATQEALSTTNGNVTTAQADATNALNRQVAFSATCSTGATTAAKTASCTNFPALAAGATVTVRFSNASTATSAITLNVNSTGAKTVYVNGAATSSTNQLLWAANANISFTYDGTYWRVDSEPRTWYGTGSVAAGTAAKTATINEIVVCKGTMAVLNMTYENTNTSATLNITSTGAKNIYYGTTTTRPTTANGYGWAAASTVSFVFDGAYWRIGDTTSLKRVTNAESSITQTANSIVSLVANTDTYTAPDGTTQANTIKSAISQNASDIALRVEKSGVIAAINASVEQEGGSAVKIQASKVNVEGATIFTSGRLSQTSLNNAYDAKGAAAAVQTNLDNMEVGGRNLLLGTAESKTKTVTSVNSSNYVVFDYYNLYAPYNQIVVVDDLITVSFDWSCTATTGSFHLELGASTPYTWGTVVSSTGTRNSASNYVDVTSSNQAGHVSITFKATSAHVSAANTLISFRIRCDSAEWVGKSISISKAKAERGNVATDWTPAPEDMASASTGVYYATCSTAAGTAVKVATTEQSGFTLVPGAMVNVKFTATNSAAVADLKLNVDGTGDKPIKYIYNNSLNNIPGVGYLLANNVYTFRYDGTNWVVQLMYNTDTQSRTRWQNVILAAGAMTSGHIICGTASGYKDIAASVTFDLSYPLLYCGTTKAAGGTSDNNFLQINGVNVTNNGTVTSAANYKTVYLVGTVSGNTFTIKASPFMTTVEPTSEDGFFYIPLGVFYNSTTNIYFNSSKDLYAFLDGEFRQATPTEVVAEQQIYIQASSVSDAPTAPTAWVEESGESITYGTQDDASTITTSWTVKHPTYDRNRPVTFVATQRKRLDGTITCSNPLPDDTTTIIDGGNIITHSIQAHAIEAKSLKLSNFNSEVTDKLNGYDQAVDDVSTLSNQVNSMSKKTALIEGIQTQLTAQDGKLTTITNSFRVSNGKLELTTDDGSESTSVELTSTKLAFIDNNNEVASIGEDKLDIQNAEVHGTLAFGGFAFIPRSNGNLSLKWIGA